MNCLQLGVEAHSCWQEAAVCGWEDRSKGRPEATQAKFLKQEGEGEIGWDKSRIGDCGEEGNAEEPGAKYGERKRTMLLCRGFMAE